MNHFTITRGEQPPTAGAPVQRIGTAGPVRQVALLGQDMPHLRPQFEVAEGDRVSCGQTLFRDRRHPLIAYVSPIEGVISQLVYGPRRSLSSCVIAAGNGDPVTHQPISNNTSKRDQLLSRGFWPAFRTRPFGKTPAPDAIPQAVFVNTAQASPQAPDPRIVLQDQIAAFHEGVSILTGLTKGLVYICQSHRARLGPVYDRVRTVTFRGSHAAGLSGTHVDLLHPVGMKRQVWVINYQDVAAIGHLFLSGQHMSERVVSIAGPAVNRPRLVRTVLGARIADICPDEPAVVRSGDPISGREAQFLGRYHDQITLDGVDGFIRQPNWLSRYFGSNGALIPTRALDKALAPDIPVVPLLRALGVGDAEAARRLGALALVEEDVAALSRHCTSGADYGLLLRQVLDDLMTEAA